MEKIDSQHGTKIHSGYKDVLLKEANRLRENNTLCDVTLCVNTRRFRANKALLAAGSPFYLCLFTSKMSESLSDEVRLEGVDVEIMQDVLKYIYTGEIAITQENAQEVVKAADFLMITSLKEIGSEFLKQSLEPSKCFSVLEFAEKYCCNALRDATIDFICERFMDVSELDEFVNLDYEVIVKIFASDDTVVSKEEKIYEALVQWLRHDYKTRKKYIEKLFTCIRLPSMSTSYLKKIVLNENIVTDNFNCMKHILHSMSVLSLSDGHPDEHTPRKCLMKDEIVIVCCGGYQFQGGNRDKRCFAYIPSLKQVKCLKSMLAARAEHSAAMCENHLYCMGTDGEKGNTAEVYNPRLNYWTPISKLPVKLNACSAVTLDESVYLIGGSKSSHPSKRVYRYDPFGNQWAEVSSMRVAREELCGVAFDGFIYVFGGEGGEGDILRCAERYNPDMDRWTDIAQMTRRRYCACATVVGEKLFVIGGHDGQSVTSSCEMYDIKEDCWFEQCSTCVPRHAAGVATLGGKVYLMGGWDGSNYLDTMECYDKEENRWSLVGSNPFGKQAWIRCGVLSVPRTTLGI